MSTIITSGEGTTAVETTVEVGAIPATDLSAAATLAEAFGKLSDLGERIIKGCSGCTPMQDRATATVIQLAAGVKKINTDIKTAAEALSQIALNIATGKLNASTVQSYVSALGRIADKVEAKDWVSLVDIVDPEAKKVEEPPATKATATPTAAPSSRIIAPLEYPAVEAPEVPSVALNPADPMSALAQSMDRLLRPTIQAIAAGAEAAAVNRLRPVVERIHDAASRPAPVVAPTAPAVDPATVSDIVDKKLHNGAGEIIRKEAMTALPSAMMSLLDAAAKSVATVAPAEDPSVVTLMASRVPDADPAYSWTEDMKVISDLIESASAMEPQNLLIVGPSGCGKTEFAIQHAARFGRKTLRVDCANMREARDWFGTKDAANGSTYFRKSQFWLACEAGDHVIILDEFNRITDHVRNVLMPLLEPGGRRETFVDVVGEMLKVGPRAVFIACMNFGLEYSGTHNTDAAMVNRFPRKLEVTYLPEAKEIEVIMAKVPGLTASDADKLVSIANTIRAKVAVFGGGLSFSISTRHLIAIARDYVIGGVKTFPVTVFSHFSAEGGADSERAQVINMFTLKGYAL